MTKIWIIWIGLRKIKDFESEVRIDPRLNARNIKKKFPRNLYEGEALNHVYLVTWMSLSVVPNASCLYFVNFSVLLAPMLFCCGHAISQIQIFLLVFNSKIKSGLPAAVAFCRCISKSHTSFALSFSQLIPAVLPKPLQE